MEGGGEVGVAEGGAVDGSFGVGPEGVSVGVGEGKAVVDGSVGGVD